jgi:hypothetical protein
MKHFRFVMTLLTLFVPLLLAARCGPEPKVPGISLLPKTQTVVMGGAATKLTATVVNSSASVTWSLNGEGTLSSTKGESVDYTPPASILADTTAEITATLEGTTLSAKAVITIQSAATAPGTGVITVTIAGLGSTNAAVTVTGPNGFNQQPTATKTFTNLPPGTYTVTAQDIASGADTYQPDNASQTVDLKAGQTLEAKINYSLSLGTLYVNAATGADTNSGANDKPFKTIMKALATAVAGQTVKLAKGTYSASTGETFPLKPKSGVTLEGVPLESVPFARAIISGGSCLALEAVENVKLAQLEFQCEESVYMLDAKNITVEQLEIASVNAHSSFTNAVEVRNSSVTMSGVEIYDSQQAGLLVTGTSKITLTSSDLRGNQFGVELGDTAQLSAENSSFSENTSSGIFMRDDASLILENSSASLNGDASNGAAGLAINSTGNGSVTINNSTFSNNSSEGINVHSGFAGTNNFEVRITNSTFAYNTYGIAIGDVEGFINLNKNKFVANTVYQLSYRRPNKPSANFFDGYIYALETTVEDSTGVSKQLTGLKRGPGSDTTDWEITNANNRICFDESCLP